jgi:hypothetical protein
VELHKGAPRNIVTAFTTTMADVSEGKTANTHMYAKSVAGVILRDSADNEQIQQMGRWNSKAFKKYIRILY